MAAGPIELQYCTSNGASIAYADVESAVDTERVLLLVLDLSTEACLDAPTFEFWAGLRWYGRWVMPDLRGCGASDTMDVEHPLSPEDRVDDLVAVLDAVGSEQVTIVALSDGVPQALLFTDRHPERVEALILFGAHAVGLSIEDYGTTLDELHRHWVTGSGRSAQRLVAPGTSPSGSTGRGSSG